MAYNREGYAPWSLTRKAGVQSATVNGDIEVPQYVQPVLDTGFVDEKGDWKGTKSSDEQFIISDTDVGIAKVATVLLPSTSNADFIDMTGFRDLMLALKTTNGGNYAFEAVMGPATTSFANLSPVDEASQLRVNNNNEALSSFGPAFSDSAEVFTADVWEVFNITSVMANQKNCQFKITNNSGSTADITFAYLRVV